MSDLERVESALQRSQLRLPATGNGRTVAFDSFAGWLVTVTENGKVFQWTLDVELLCHKACLMAGRDLTEEERQFYCGEEVEYPHTRIDDSGK